MKYHVFVCTTNRPPVGGDSCARKNSGEILSRLRELVDEKGLQEEVKINETSCLGPCEQGPTMVVYPEGFWYAGFNESDLTRIVESHFERNEPVADLKLQTLASGEN